MTPTDTILVLMLPALLAGSAACSAVETAIFSLTYGDLVRLKRGSPAAWRAVETLRAQPRQLLVSILFVNNAINVAYLAATSILSRSLAHPLAGVGLGALNLLGMILMAEIVPKLLAAKLRVPVTRLTAPSVLLAYRVLGPVRRVVDAAVIGPLSRLVRPRAPGGAGEPGQRAATGGPAISPEHIEALLTQSASEGIIDDEEQRLLTEVVGLGAMRVREVMTPRVDLDFLRDTDTRGAVMAALRRRRRRYIPVCRQGHEDDILGWLDATRYLDRAMGEPGPGPAVAGFVEPIRFVPASARLDQLLDEFRRTRTRRALCVDELGAVVGQVELAGMVGQLYLAPSRGEAAERVGFEPLGGGRWRVTGRLSVSAWADFFGPTGPAVDRRVSTVAGLLLSRLGRVPRPGDAVRIGNVRLEVESVAGRAIDSVIVSIERGAGAGAVDSGRAGSRGGVGARGGEGASGGAP